MPLTESELKRYSRNILLKDFGREGQKKLLGSRILIIGIGGLGSACAYYLAAAGVGNIGIVDNDKVEESNLQRQIIHFTTDLKKQKTKSASEKLTKLNPGIKIVPYRERITSSNIEDIITDQDYDFVIDATDNFESKFLINDGCVRLKKAFSHAGVVGYNGQTFTYVPGNSCYRCIFGQPPPENKIESSSRVGILGVVAGIIGTIQATEAIKYILKIGDLLINRLLIYDAVKMRFRIAAISRNPDCPVCGGNPIITGSCDDGVQG